MLQEKLTHHNIILASSSPRRQKICKDLGFNFTIRTIPVNEIYPQQLKAKEITEYLAKLKADVFKDILKNNDLLITSDTIVWFNDKALEKPKSKEEAFLMLKSLSNNYHEVFTSICLTSTSKQVLFSDITKVYFKKLSDDELNYYVDNFETQDKAGAYGIQDWLGLIGINKIEGSYYNVMGLPVHKLYEELIKF